MQARWLEARERMRPSIDAVISQESGIPVSARQNYVDWILDVVVRDEYMAAISDRWTVWRKDEHGNEFVVQSDLSHEDAMEMVSRLQDGGHKQVYWLEPAVSKT